MKPYSTTKTASVICTATPYTELDESHTALELAYQDLTRLRAQNAELVKVLREVLGAGSDLQDAITAEAPATAIEQAVQGWQQAWRGSDAALAKVQP